MRKVEPLEEWLFIHEMRQENHPARDAGREAEWQQHAEREMQQALQELAAVLDNAGTQRPDYYKTRLRIMRYGKFHIVALPSTDVAIAQELTRRVIAAGGTGSVPTQEGLLHVLALTADPVSIPFWRELLDIRRPRDSFAKTRRKMALAALAFLAITRNEPAAYAALQELLQHANPDVRSPAVRYLGRAYLDAARPFPTEVQADLTQIATQDKTFLARFHARMALHDAELPVPLDNPEGIYAFKVRLVGDKNTYRTIALHATRTLEDLHTAIQSAFKWDSDHLYSFYMNGEVYAEDYQFSCPFEDDAERWTDEAVIGELGLTLKHKFVYFFDYGDSNEFEIEVVDITPQAKPDDDLKIIASQGKAPRQYPYADWDEELDAEEEVNDEEYNDR
jgi:hypothetical protein